MAYKAPSGPGQPERSFLREIEVSPKYYRGLPSGSAVPLRYIRTDPAVSRLEHPEIDRLNAGVDAVIATIPLSMAGVFVLSGLQCCSQLIQLACFGRSIPGQVVNCWTKTVCEMGLDEEHYEIQHYISYVFQPPNGARPACRREAGHRWGLQRFEAGLRGAGGVCAAAAGDSSPSAPVALVTAVGPAALQRWPVSHPLPWRPQGLFEVRLSSNCPVVAPSLFCAGSAPDLWLPSPPPRLLLQASQGFLVGDGAIRQTPPPDAQRAVGHRFRPVAFGLDAAAACSASWL